MRYCLFHIFAILITAEAAILDDQFVKKIEQIHARTYVTQHWSEFIQRSLRIVIFMFSLFVVTATNGHLGLHSHIN